MIFTKIIQLQKKHRWLPWAIFASLTILLLIIAIIIYPPAPPINLSIEESNWLSAHRTISLAANPDYPPLEYFDERGSYSGMMSEYFHQIERNLNIRIQIIRYPSLTDALFAAKNKKIDGITLLQPSKDQLTYLNPTNPVTDIPNVIITSIRYASNIELEDMAGWKLAISRENANIDYIKANFPYITLLQADTDLNALQLVSFERSDAALVNQAVATYLIEQYGITNLRVSGDSGKNNPLSIAIRSDEPELHSILEKGQASISESKKNEIFRRWIGLTRTNVLQTSQFWNIVFWAIFAITILLGGFLTWTKALQTQVSTKTLELNRELSERRAAENKLNQQLDNLSALRAVGVAINASMDLPLTLNILLDQVSSKLNVDACNFLLFNPYTRSLEHAAEKGFKNVYNRDLSQGSENTSLAWKAIQSRRLVIEDLNENPGGFNKIASFEQEGFVSYICAPLISKGLVKGVLEMFSRVPFSREPEWMDFLEAMTAQAAIALDNATMFLGLQRANLDITLAYDATIEGWAKALELKDGNTEGHSKRVTQLTLDLAVRMGIRNEELVHVRRGALLHDIGKMGIPDNILNKPGPLTPEEWETMKKHPSYAVSMLENVVYLSSALDIPASHHEKWDGTGYPNGLKGIRIPLAARVFSVIDVWDALTSDRPYRKAWSEPDTLKYIQDNAGSQFDPDVVDEFMKMIHDQNRF